jgi:hypothetical protein
VSPDVADGLRRRSKGLAVHALSQWEKGRLLGQSDETILEAAALVRLTLVTYDLRTIPRLLKVWAESERHYAGVILVDEKTIPPSDIGGLIRALGKLVRETADWDWTDQVVFLRR